jgi:hypothetical protein
LQFYFELGEGIWQAINPVLSTFDSIVQKYVWPTGGTGSQIGYVWKYTCIIYNCRFYTLSGLIEVASDAASAIEKRNEGKIVGGTPSQEVKDENGNVIGTTTSTEFGDGSTVTIQKNNDGTEITTTTNKNGQVRTEVRNPDKSYSVTTEKSYSSGGAVTTTVEYDNSGNPKGKITAYLDADDTVTYEISTRNNDGTYNIQTGSIDTSTLAKDSNGDYILPENLPIDKTYTNVKAESTATSGGIGGLIGGTKIIPGYDISDSDAISVSESITDNYDGEIINKDAAQRQNLQSIGQQGALYGDIDRHDWIINPYRSAYYDGLCLPATVYNIQKERQIKCMYLSCLQDSQNTGLPVSVCKDLYQVNNCLYLESAQYRLNSNIFAQIGKGLIQQSIMYLMGYAVQTAYSGVCSEYIESYGSGELNANGWHAVGCGLLGAGLKYQEISALLKSPAEVMNNLFKGAGVDDPAKIYDYCDGGKLYAD